MEKRSFERTNVNAGVIGLGCEGFEGKTAAECQTMVDYAIRNGINFFDMYTSNPAVRQNVSRALQKYPRGSYYIQGHICSCWKNGQYYRTRALSKVKESFESLFACFGSDYIDIGMIHYIDTAADFGKVFNGDLLKYCKELKAQGKIRSIGISTHNTDIAIKAAESGEINVIMFSINPAYDMLPAIDDVNRFFEDGAFDVTYSGIDPKREELYRLCETNGVALTVMKCFAGGLLLDKEQTLFGSALTPVQCLHYCLTRPAVKTVLAGASNIAQIEACLKYCTASDKEKDFAAILGSAPKSSFSGHCMYCGHCAPCSVKIDVASVNKYSDLVQAKGELSETVKEHYFALAHHASECIACGNCIKNCPFGVDIIEKMRTASKLFGK